MLQLLLALVLTRQRTLMLDGCLDLVLLFFPWHDMTKVSSLATNSTNWLGGCNFPHSCVSSTVRALPVFRSSLLAVWILALFGKFTELFLHVLFSMSIVVVTLLLWKSSSSPLFFYSAPTSSMSSICSTQLTLLSSSQSLRFCFSSFFCVCCVSSELMHASRWSM